MVNFTLIYHTLYTITVYWILNASYCYCTTVVHFTLKPILWMSPRIKSLMWFWCVACDNELFQCCIHINDCQYIAQSAHARRPNNACKHYIQNYTYQLCSVTKVCIRNAVEVEVRVGSHQRQLQPHVRLVGILYCDKGNCTLGAIPEADDNTSSHKSPPQVPLHFVAKLRHRSLEQSQCIRPFICIR